MIITSCDNVVIQNICSSENQRGFYSSAVELFYLYFFAVDVTSIIRGRNYHLIRNPVIFFNFVSFLSCKRPFCLSNVLTALNLVCCFMCLIVCVYFILL
jgi:hypothetical protein